MIRIATGHLKGKTIKVPEFKSSFKSSKQKNPNQKKRQFRKEDLRPTKSMVKKAFFDLLERQVGECKRFLDLFAGTGSVGFEAFSNGAEEVYWVEKNPTLVQHLKDYQKEFDIPGQVFFGSHEQALDYYRRKNLTFEIIFIDPPYHYYQKPNFASKLLEKIVQYNLLNDLGSSVIVMERGKVTSDNLSKRVPARVPAEQGLDKGRDENEDGNKNNKGKGRDDEGSVSGQSVKISSGLKLQTTRRYGTSYLEIFYAGNQH